MASTPSRFPRLVITRQPVEVLLSLSRRIRSSVGAAKSGVVQRRNRKTAVKDGRRSRELFMTVGFLNVGDPAPSHTQLLRTARAWDRLDAQNNTPTPSKKGDGHGYHDFRPSALRCSAPAHKKAGPADMDVRRACP